jgi:hypothetical protein
MPFPQAGIEALDVGCFAVQPHGALPSRSTICADFSRKVIHISD